MKYGIVIIVIASLFITNDVLAQKYFTRDGNISFYSDAPMEKIEAHNKKATSVIDVETGQMEFAVLIKSFHFEKALMQEHFNENYMESSKYPKAKFRGEVLNMESVNLTKNGEYPVNVTGALTIHGETNDIETTGTFTVKDGVISAFSTFEVFVADYKIDIPKIVRDNIARVVKIDVDIQYEELKS
jgi:hypothetical protein